MSCFVLFGQDVMSQAEVVLGNVLPASVCRSLSAIGRRVLSIESVAALQGLCVDGLCCVLQHLSSV